MILAILLGCHLIGLVGYTLLLRKSAVGNINKLLLAALMQTGVFLPVLVLLLLGSPLKINFSGAQWVSLATSSLLLVGVNLTTIKALEHLEASVFTIIYNLRLFFTTILGFIFLHELPSALQVSGGIVIFASILLLNLHKNRRYASTPILLGLFATVWFSVHATLEKYNVVQVGFVDYMFWAQGFAALMLWGMVLKSDVKLSAVKASFDWHTIRLVVLRVVSAWGYTYALKYGSLAVINYVSGMGVALIVLFGILLLGERNYLKQKIYAVVVAVFGLTLILIGRL